MALPGLAPLLSRIGLSAAKRDAAGVELLRVRFMRRAGKYVDLVSPAQIDEADLIENPPPLCFQQSPGNSTGP